MNQDQITVIIFSALGAMAGIISNLFAGFLSFLIPLIVYFVACYSLIRSSKSKKTSLILNSLVTFILVWLLVWIFLYNSGW